MENNPAPFLIKELILHPRRHWRSWILLFILTIITYGGTWVAALKKGKNSAKIELSQQMKQICGGESTSEGPSQPQSNCIKKSFSEKEWETEFYEKGRDGFWCPVKFVDPVMWYRDGLGANFQKISLEYKIKTNDDLKTDNPPSFIFTYGRENKNEVPILKLWVPENPNLQLFGFAKNLNFDSEKQLLTREESTTLPDPVKTERNDTFTVTRTRAEGNELFLDFNYHYTSSLNLDDQNKTIQKVVKLPISNVEISVRKFPLGIGTYKGNCIGEISYEICQ